MLNNQHQKVTRCITTPERRIYKHYMCTVCHALGDDFGLVSRIFTNHETILLNMLTDAQMESPPETVMRRCPLRPTRQVTTSRNTSSRFAAAVTVLLVNAGIVDDSQDAKGLNLRGRFLEKLLSGMTESSRAMLDNLSFDTTILETLPAQQLQAESAGLNPVVPSMSSSSAIFAMTADLAGSPRNRVAMAEIGANYGAYVYLYDALEDWGKDYQNGEFNPLTPYLHEQSDRITLSSDGIDWIADQFSRILSNIRRELTQLTLHHHTEAIQKLLTDPIERILKTLSKNSDGISIRKISRLDLLKTALLLKDDHSDPIDALADTKDKNDKKSRKSSFCSDTCSGCYWTGDCNCGDSCGDVGCDVCGDISCDVCGNIDCGDGCDVCGSFDCDCGDGCGGCDGCGDGGCD